jgi:hypothetical protein
MESDTEPTIEEIKKIANERRVNKKQAKPRASRSKTIKEIKVEELTQPIELPLSLPTQASLPTENKDDKYKEIYEDIKNIKELINQQTNFIQEVINKPKEKKQRAKPKLKQVNKTLDLTVLDKEVNEILEDKPKKKDNRLEEIIKALQKY